VVGSQKTIAYIVNQYPKVSHSFIRREIQALERAGVRVLRYSIRATPLAELVDDGDRLEHGKTMVILGSGLKCLLVNLLVVMVAQPVRFFCTLALVTRMGLHSQRGMLRHWIYLVEACWLARSLHAHGVANLHAHFGTNSATVAMCCRLLGGPPYSLTVHGPEEFDDPIGLGLGQKIQHAKFVVAVSHFGRSQLLRHCPVEQWPKIYVIHCTVEDLFAQDTEVPITTAPRLVCVGRLCAQKGQLLLLAALKELAGQGIPFEMVLAGDGEMRAMVEACIHTWGLDGKVRITGWISGEQVKAELIACRAMVLPSFAEGLPVVIMEALALRRPVVSTYVAGIPELVVTGVNGWLVPAGSVADLVLALKGVLAASPEELQRMGREGAARVAEHHNPVTEAHKLRALFEA
jgi:glycosyltransferase involved in cell wall biosynthesis